MPGRDSLQQCKGDAGIRTPLDDLLSLVEQLPSAILVCCRSPVVGLVALNFQTTFPSMVRFGFDRGDRKSVV